VLAETAHTPFGLHADCVLFVLLLALRRCSWPAARWIEADPVACRGRIIAMAVNLLRTGHAAASGVCSAAVNSLHALPRRLGGRWLTSSSPHAGPNAHRRARSGCSRGSRWVR
jgi:hypothetical protein